MAPLPTQLFVLIEWMNGNPVMDGSTYCLTKEECMEVSERKMKRYEDAGVLDEVDVKHRIIRVYKKD